MRPNFISILSAGLILLASLPARPEGAGIQFSDGLPLLKQPLTLAQALKAAEPPRTETFLVVGSEKIVLPKDAPPLTRQDRAYRIGQKFGCVVHTFHNVIAIAPATMTVLNLHPRALDPYAGAPPSDAFRLLISMLDKAQWKILTGPDGIGLSELSTEAQRQLFVDIFPEKPLLLSPQGSGTWSKDPPTLSRDKADGARLRVTRQTSFVVSVAGDQQGFSTIEAPSSSDRTYNAGYDFFSQQQAVDAIYGDRLRASVPNILKESDLNYDANALAVDVDVTNVKTLGELMMRIGAATRTELYADRRYEKQTLLILGPRIGNAGDFLKAAALGACGTFRKVGPAYILTNDRMGLGTRQAILSRFLRDTEMARKKAIVDAGDTLVGAHHVIDLTDTDDSAELSEAQIKRLSANTDISSTIQLSFSELTPNQQAIVQEGVRNNNDTVKPGFGSMLTMEKPIGLWVSPKVTMTSSKIYGLVTLDEYVQSYDAMNPSGRSAQRERFHDEEAKARLEQETAQKEQEQDPDIGLTYGPLPRPILDQTLVHFSRRAVIVRPKSAKELDRIIAVMKRIGFNQLWLDVFSAGESHLHEHPDILEAAIAKTKGTGVIVIPTVDALDWSADAPEEVRDLTMLGETSLQDAAWNRQNMSSEFYRYSGWNIPLTTQKDLWVCPATPFVTNVLTTLLRRLAATPGVAAVALRHMASSGYGPPGGGEPLGYTPPLRLAFLRRDHIDPLDFNASQSYGTPNITQLVPEFQEDASIYDARKDWDAFRFGAQKRFHQELFAALRNDERGGISMFVCADTPSQWPPWYSLWDDPTTPVPQFIRPAGMPVGKEPPISQYAHAHWRRNIALLPFGPGQSRRDLISAINKMTPEWDGFVADFTDDNADNPFRWLSQRKRAIQQ